VCPRRPLHQAPLCCTTHTQAQNTEKIIGCEINNAEVAASNGGSKQSMGVGYLAFHSISKKQDVRL